MQRSCNLRVTTFHKGEKGPIPFKGMRISCEISQLVLRATEELKHSTSASDFFCLGIAEQCFRMELCEGTEDAGVVHTPVKFTFTKSILVVVTGGAVLGVSCTACHTSF